MTCRAACSQLKTELMDNFVAFDLNLLSFLEFKNVPIKYFKGTIYSNLWCQLTWYILTCYLFSFIFSTFHFSFKKKVYISFFLQGKYICGPSLMCRLWATVTWAAMIFRSGPQISRYWHGNWNRYWLVTSNADLNKLYTCLEDTYHQVIQILTLKSKRRVNCSAWSFTLQLCILGSNKMHLQSNSWSLKYLNNLSCYENICIFKIFDNLDIIFLTPNILHFPALFWLRVVRWWPK